MPKKHPKRALIDADVLRYELCFGAEYKDGEEYIVRDWDFVEELLERKLFIIKEQTGAVSDPRFYLTNDERTTKIYNRWAKTYGKEPIEFFPNFRHSVATVKEYKSSRKNPKPAHYDNFTAHIMYNYEFSLGNGVEADDLLAMDQTDETIICSRDKDLRQVPGWHYSWECGRQGEVGPIYFDKKGHIEEIIKESKSKFLKDGSPKVDKSCFGGGEMFFMYQLIAGDNVDDIPGLPKAGHRKAFDTVFEGTDRKSTYEAIKGLYSDVYGEDGLTRLTEQARLLWLLRAKDDVWEYPYETS